MRRPAAMADSRVPQIQFDCYLTCRGWPVTATQPGDRLQRLRDRERRGRVRAGQVGQLDLPGELGGDLRPALVAVASVQVSATEAAREPGYHERTDDARRVAGADQQVRDTAGHQLVDDLGARYQSVSENHQIGAVRVVERDGSDTRGHPADGSSGGDETGQADLVRQVAGADVLGLDRALRGHVDPADAGARQQARDGHSQSSVTLYGDPEV